MAFCGSAHSAAFRIAFHKLLFCRRHVELLLDHCLLLFYQRVLVLDLLLKPTDTIQELSHPACPRSLSPQSHPFRTGKHDAT